MKLIVGLGNPGREYEHTRHNVGFQVAEELAHRYHVTLKDRGSWKARVAKIPDIGDGVLLAEPTTFMNLSGWPFARSPAFTSSRPRMCSLSWTMRTCRWGACGCGRADRPADTTG